MKSLPDMAGRSAYEAGNSMAGMAQFFRFSYLLPVVLGARKSFTGQDAAFASKIDSRYSLRFIWTDGGWDRIRPFQEGWSWLTSSEKRGKQILKDQWADTAQRSIHHGLGRRLPTSRPASNLALCG